MAKSRRRNKPFPNSQSSDRHQVPIDTRQRLIQLHNQGKHSETLALAENLTKRYPRDAFAWKAMGIALSENQLLEQAVEPLKKAHALAPKDAEICNSLGRACFYLGRADDALLYTEKALDLEPGFQQAHIRLTRILVDSGQHQKALHHINQALELEPTSLELRSRKAHALQKSGSFSEGLALYEEISREHPDDPEALSNLAVSYTNIGRFAEAEAAYRQAHDLQPGNPVYLSNLLTAMHYNPAHDAETIRNAHLEWERLFRPSGVQRRHSTNPNPSRRLRIGMISAGFRTHPVGLMISSALQHLPRAEFELFAYSMNNKVDDVTRLLAQRFDHWLSITQLSDEALAEQIRADDIDILIDLCGHGEGNRNLTMALEPAPLQVKWVGLQINTSGLSAMDYMISDSVETPPGVDSLYVEKLIRLPDDYICYLPPSSIPPVAMLPCATNGFITFGCFNNPSKVNAVVIEQWSRILNGVPNSRLFLKGNQYNTSEFVDRIIREFETHGVSKQRLIFEGLSPHAELMACYNRVDIALDPWPYSGGLTTCEALLMGVPVITYPGPTFAGRHSATHLVNAGLRELVVDDWDHYVSLAISLAKDVGNLATIRLGLRLQLTNSPICDDQRFATHLRTALRAIWQRYCEGKAPAALTFDKQGGYWFSEDNQADALNGCASSENEDGAFEWNLDSKVIAIDNGGQLLNHPAAQGMLTRERLEAIVLDPLGQHINNAAANQQGVHYYPNASLGDGEEATLYVCEDVVQSATLKPLTNEWLSDEEKNSREVVEQHPIATVPLDKIEGLPSVDWLILDARHNAHKILESGKTALKNSLVIQAKVAFQPSYEHQPTLVELQHWAGRNGYRFYRLNQAVHKSYFPASAQLQSEGSELVEADAIFLPGHDRMARLDNSQRAKLAYIASTALGIKDLAYTVLRAVDADLANQYLAVQKNAQVEESRRASSKSTKREGAPSLLLDKGRVPTVAVGVPAYNEEKYIEATLRSLKEQDYDDAVFLISDNASTDRTFEIIQDLAGDDPRFKVHRQKANIGASENFEFVLNNVDSKYFMWLGAHDFLSSNYLESVTAILQANPGTAMACGIPYGTFDGKKSAPVQQALYNFTDDDPLTRYIRSVAELSNCTIFHSLFEKRLLDNLQIRKTLSSDHVLISRLLWFGKLQFADQAQYFRRYFEARTGSTEERLLGDKKDMPRADFFRYYDDDFAALLMSAPHISAGQARKERARVQDILLQRFLTN